MKKLLAGSIAAAALISGPVMAADMPVKYRAPAVAIFSWTGCYVGANAGGKYSRDRYELSPGGNYRSPSGGAAPPNAAGTGLNSGDFALLTNSYASDDWGGVAGVQVGCNIQNGNLVWGFEADWQWTSLNQSREASYGAFPNSNPAFTFPAHTESVSTRAEWFTTYRARAGIAFDRVLIYLTAGAAIERKTSETTVSFGTFPVLPVLNGAVHIGSASETKLAFVGGGGVEYAFTNNWSVKAEYLYINFGNFSYFSPLVSATAPAVVGPGYSWRTDVREQEHVIRLGLNYRFDWASPVVAKY
jgi:outer membrane immunogenic protein